MEHQVINLELLDIDRFVSSCLISKNNDNFHLTIPLLMEQNQFLKTIQKKLELEIKYLQLLNEVAFLKYENELLKETNK